MTKMTALKILAAFFNNGDGKRDLRVFGAELKQLTDAEKEQMSLEVLALPASELERLGAASLVGAELISK